MIHRSNRPRRPHAAARARTLPMPQAWLDERMRGVMQRAVVALVLLGAFASFAFAQASVEWHTTDGGGGTSSGGGYSISGTIGQADAGSAQTPTQLRADNGYWSGIAPAAPGGNGLFADSFE